VFSWYKLNSETRFVFTKVAAYISDSLFGWDRLVESSVPSTALTTNPSIDTSKLCDLVF